MTFKHQKRERQLCTYLTPWETQPDQSCINKYCSDYIQAKIVPKNPANLPKLSKRRAISTCNNHKRVSDLATPNQKVSIFRPNIDALTEINHKNFNTLSHHRSEKPQKKKTQRGNALQQLSVKNFIIQGGQEPVTIYKEKILKKRESSYILKQKFAEFRRSMKMVGQNKQNTNFRVVRYEN